MRIKTFNFLLKGSDEHMGLIDAELNCFLTHIPNQHHQYSQETLRPEPLILKDLKQTIYSTNDRIVITILYEEGIRG